MPGMLGMQVHTGYAYTHTVCMHGMAMYKPPQSCMYDTTQPSNQHTVRSLHRMTLLLSTKVSTADDCRTSMLRGAVGGILVRCWSSNPQPWAGQR